MKRFIIISLVFFVLAVSAMEFKDMKVNYRFLYNAFKKESALKAKYPQYSNLISTPSKRDIINYNSKAVQDTVRVLVLKIEFLEDTTVLTTGNGKMDLRGSNDSRYSIDTTYGDDGNISSIDTSRNLYFQPPHDSIYFRRQMDALQNYYLDDSHNKLFVDFDIYPKGLTECYTVTHQMPYYGDTLNAVLGLFSLFRDALYSAQFSGGIDFTKFDAVIIFHAGSMWQTDYNYDSPFDLPAVYIQGADYVFGQPVNVGGKDFNDGIIYSETGNQDGGIAFIQGGLVHEFAHQLGVYDLYDVSGNRMGMGGWALQGTGNWNLNGMVPPHQGSYNGAAKFNSSPNSDYSNWVYFNQTKIIDKDTTKLKIKYLGANEDTSIKIYKIPINSHEYYLIENRMAYMSSDTLSSSLDSNGFRLWKDDVLVKIDDYDVSLPPPVNEGGLAIYHIDESIIEADSGYNMINAGEIFGIDMEEADRVQDFELYFSDVTDFDKAFYGTYEDLFYKLGTGEKFTPKTMPNTNANNGGFSHLYIYDVSMSDTIMTFSVLYDYRVKDFPFELKTSPDVNSPNVVKINGDNVIFLQTMLGEVYALGNDGHPYFNESGIVASFNSSNESYSTPAFGSVCSKNSTEMIVTSYEGDLHVLRTDTVNDRGVFLPVSGSPYNSKYGFVSSAVLADIDNDTLDEILVTGEDLFLHILEFESGALVTKDSIFLSAQSWSLPIVLEDKIITLAFDGVVRGFDFEGDEIFSSITENVQYTMTSPLAADIDGDGILEIVFIRGDGVLFSVSSEDGAVEFEKHLNLYPFYSSPVAGDINGDGSLEIVLLLAGKIFVFDYNGNILNNYPVETADSKEIQSIPLIADLNDDGINDILIHTQNGLLKGYSNKVLPGFPISTGQYSNSTPYIGDLDGDSLIDIIATADMSVTAFELDSRVSQTFWGSMHLNSSNNRLYEFKSDISYGDELIIPDNNTYLYPNPAIDHFTLRFNTDAGTKYSYMIFDQSGTLKVNSDSYSCKRGVNEKYIDVASLAPGFYRFRLEVSAGVEKGVKMINLGVKR